MVSRAERRTEDGPVERIGSQQDQRGRESGEEPQQETPFPAFFPHEYQDIGQKEHRIRRGTHGTAQGDQHGAPHQRRQVDPGPRHQTGPQDHRPYAEKKIRHFCHRVTGQGDEERTEQKNRKRQKSGPCPADGITFARRSRSDGSLPAGTEHDRRKPRRGEPAAVHRAVNVAGNSLKGRKEEQGEPWQIA